MTSLIEEKEASEKHVLDIRKVALSERCLRIATAFEALLPASSFILVTDVDPESHHCHLTAELGERVQWQILQKGPDIWRIRIIKKS